MTDNPMMVMDEPLSYWLTTIPRLKTPGPLPTRAQVVVVGGGIMGVSIAYWLARSGAHTLLLERGGLASGATGRNAGIVSPGTTENYLTTCATLGDQAGKAIWQFTEDSAALLKRLVLEERLEVDYRNEGSHALALTIEEEATQQRTIDRLEQDGFDLEWLDRAALQDRVGLPLPPDIRGARFNPRGAVAHSGRLVQALAQAAIRHGATIRQGVTVEGLGDQTVATQHGVVQADHIILALNAYTGVLLPELSSIITPVRGQMRATQPLPMRVFPGAWSANAGGEYWQQTTNGSFVLGGMRRRASDQDKGYTHSQLNPVVQAALDEFVAHYFPSLASTPVTHRWAGIMGFTPDATPLIGPLRPGVWIAGGCTGHGMPFTTEAGRQLAHWICRGAPDRDMSPFDPGRFD